MLINKSNKLTLWKYYTWKYDPGCLLEFPQKTHIIQVWCHDPKEKIVVTYDYDLLRTHYNACPRFTSFNKAWKQYVLEYKKHLEKVSLMEKKQQQLIDELLFVRPDLTNSVRLGCTGEKRGTVVIDVKADEEPST